MNQLGPIRPLLAELRLINQVPETLDNGIPAAFWKTTGPLTNETAKKLHMLVTRFVSDAREALCRKDFKTGARIQSQMRICEEWLRYLIW